MKRAAAFLHGVYRRPDLPFYRALCRGRLKLAVDGGYSFFRKSGLAPDILLGDFDSLKRLPRDLSQRTKILKFPARKDKTDAHLAIDYCLDLGIENIDLVMPGCGDMDHDLGSILLLGLAGLQPAHDRHPIVRVINRAYEVRLITDSELVFNRCRGDILSVLPLAEHVLLTTTGTAYDVTSAPLRFGESRGLRNRIERPKATVRIEGKALIVHRFSRQFPPDW